MMLFASEKVWRRSELMERLAAEEKEGSSIWNTFRRK
jgi:hypothetical protein